METTSSTSPTIKKPGRSGGSGHRLFDTILILLLIGAFAFIGYTEWQRQKTAKELTLTAQQLEEFKKNPQRSGDEVAKGVLEKLRKHMSFLETPAPTVATIINVDELKKENPFYAVAKNGDHLIILLVAENRGRAVLFDANADRILDTVPIDVQQTSPSPTGSPAASPSSTATPTGSPTTASPSPTASPAQ